MKKQKLINKQRWRRANRVRNKIRGDAQCLRLTVRRSNKHIYCQLVDDEAGATIVSANTREKALAGQIANGGNREAAKRIGQLIAERAKEKGVTKIRLDRGCYKYHGRIAELADAAREGGLEF